MVRSLDDLFDFQREAVDKLVDEPAVIIGDDMGLGKTVEGVVLDTLRRKKHSGIKKTLVLAPLSVISSWEDHFAEWAPELKVFCIDRRNRPTFEQLVKKAFSPEAIREESRCLVHNAKSVTLASEECATLVTTSGSKLTIRSTEHVRQLAQQLGVLQILNESQQTSKHTTSNVNTNSLEKSSISSLQSKTVSVSSATLSTQAKDAKTDWASITVTILDALGASYASVVTSMSSELLELIGEITNGATAQSCTCSPSVFVCHWDVVRLMPELQKHQWFHILADEAHRVGNREAQVTVKAKKIPHRFLTELTGTPCTSKPQQFWSLLNWAKPKRFTSYHRFFNHHVISVYHTAGGDCMANLGGTPCLKDHKVPFNVITGIAYVEELLAEIAPYYVRRLKEDVLEELPDKYYTTIKVELGAQQRRVYDQMKKEMLAWVGAHEDEPLAASQAIVKLIRLQQLACAYAEITWEKQRKKQPDGTWKIEDVRKVRLTDPSAKLDAVMEILDANPDKQFVVFSQSKQVVKLFEKRLFAKNIPYGILTGDTAQSDRGDMVAAFQRGDLRVFTGTLQAGGVGITLTAASTVIFLDRSWSPALNVQAEDRLHRIGQKEAVQVIDIVAKNTVDLGKLTKLEASWGFIKRLLGDKVVEKKPEGSYI
jgi:SNF2 family DNA or RNA helicase